MKLFSLVCLMMGLSVGSATFQRCQLQAYCNANGSGAPKMHAGLEGSANNYARSSCKQVSNILILPLFCHSVYSSSNESNQIFYYNFYSSRAISTSATWTYWLTMASPSLIF